MHDTYDSREKPFTLPELSKAAQKRLAVIEKEFANGFEFLTNYPRSVTFFGSARTEKDNKYYKEAFTLAREIVEKLHYSIITGGGPGIMEAANKGAYEAGGNSVGLTIALPKEQVTNPYLTDKLSFHYFFSRKVCLSFSAEAFIFFPGGFGTIDEFSEILTLIQTNKIPKSPMILFGSEYWKPLENFFREILLKNKTIVEEDLGIYTITDSIEEAVSIIREAPVRIGVDYDHKTKDGEEKIKDGKLKLSEKHCVPCEGGTLPLSHEDSEKFLEEVDNGWSLVEDKLIHKTYTFKDFSEALLFMNAVGKVAEKEGHHPDMRLYDFKKVDIHISTHAIEGLSENDFILASKIDDILRD